MDIVVGQISITTLSGGGFEPPPEPIQEEKAKDEAITEKKRRIYNKKLKVRYIKEPKVDLPKEVRVPYNASEMTIITKAKNLVAYIFDICEKSPKKYRFTFVDRLQNYGLDIIQEIYCANEIFLKNAHSDFTGRRKHQDSALTQIKLLNYMALLCYEKKCILLKQYKQIAIRSSECEILLKNWIESDKRRINKMI